MVQALNSSIRAVTVYSRGARITRAADLHDPFERVRISGLPLALDDRSIHVRLQPRDRERPTPAAIDVRITLDVPDLDASLAPARDPALIAVRREESQLHDLVGQVQRELGRLDRLGLVPRPKPLDGSPPAASPFDARLALIELRALRADALAVEMRELKAKLREVLRRRQELEDRERRRSTARSAQEHELRKTAIVTLDSSVGDGPGTLLLDYLVPGARWAPTYSVRFDPGRGRAEMAMRAVIAQQSGEDWGDAALTLSTADAQKFTTLPELPSLRIGPQKVKPPQIGWRPAPKGASELYGNYDAAYEGLHEPRRLRGETDRGVGSFEHEDTDDFVEDHLETTPYMDAVTREHDMSMLAGVVDDDELTASDATVAVEKSKLAKKRGKPEKARAARPTDVMFDADELAEMRAAVPQAAPAPAAMLGGAISGVTPTEAFGTITRNVETEARAITASIELLDYKAMRMPAARDPLRGRLQPEDRDERYLELLREHKIEVDFDVVRTVAEATYRAREVEYRDPPSGCTFAWSDRFDYAFEAAGTVDIPSDGRFHSVPVSSGIGGAHLRHVCVPRESTDVYRMARVENPFEAPILAGPADIYIGSDFVVTSDVPVTPSRAHLDLGLGVEQSIKLARNTRYGEDSKGILGGSRSLRHQILIEAENLLDRGVELEVRERVPVVREDEEDIRVEIGDVTPAWSKFEPELVEATQERVRGGFRWIIDVPAGEKREMRATYEIKISAKNELVGGNRREG